MVLRGVKVRNWVPKQQGGAHLGGFLLILLLQGLDLELIGTVPGAPVASAAFRRGSTFAARGVRFSCRRLLLQGFSEGPTLG